MLIVQNLLIDAATVVVPGYEVDAVRDIEVPGEVAVVETPPWVTVDYVGAPELRGAGRRVRVEHVRFPGSAFGNIREAGRRCCRERGGRQDREIVSHVKRT